MVRVFPTSTNANKHFLLALGSDRTGMDDVKTSRGGVSPHVPAGLVV